MEREELEKEFGPVWDTDAMRAEFKTIGFGAPFVVVERRKDGVRGSLEFQHHPRYYHSFREG